MRKNERVREREREAGTGARGKGSLRRGVYSRRSVNNFRTTHRPGVNTRSLSIDRPSCVINPLTANYRSIMTETERVRMYAWEYNGREREREKASEKERDRSRERERGSE